MSFNLNMVGTGSIDVELMPTWGTSLYYEEYASTGVNNNLYILDCEDVYINAGDGARVIIHVVTAEDTLSEILAPVN